MIQIGHIISGIIEFRLDDISRNLSAGRDGKRSTN